MIPKEVYYEVKYVTKSIFPGRTVSKSFMDKKRAQKFFDSLSDAQSKSLILHEETLLDKVY